MQHMLFGMCMQTQCHPLMFASHTFPQAARSLITASYGGVLHNMYMLAELLVGMQADMMATSDTRAVLLLLLLPAQVQFCLVVCCPHTCAAYIALYTIC